MSVERKLLHKRLMEIPAKLDDVKMMGRGEELHKMLTRMPWDKDD